MRLSPLIFFLFFTLLGCQDQLAKLNPMDNFSSAFQPKSRPGISLVVASASIWNTYLVVISNPARAIPWFYFYMQSQSREE